jgi:hypothetical protein
MKLTFLSKEECRKLEFAYVPNGDKYLLWAFSHPAIGTVYTRGRTAEEALELIYTTYCRCNGWKEETMHPIGAAKFYAVSLRRDDCPFADNLQWLDHPPVWILRQMEESK